MLRWQGESSCWGKVEQLAAASAPLHEVDAGQKDRHQEGRNASKKELGHCSHLSLSSFAPACQR